MKIPLSWVLIAAAVLIVLGGFLVWDFGSAKYDEGIAACAKAQSDAGVKANDDARKTKEKINAEEKAIPDDGLDPELRRLGILQPD